MQTIEPSISFFFFREEKKETNLKKVSNVSFFIDLDSKIYNQSHSSLSEYCCFLLIVFFCCIHFVSNAISQKFIFSLQIHQAIE